MMQATALCRATCLFSSFGYFILFSLATFLQPETHDTILISTPRRYHANSSAVVWRQQILHRTVIWNHVPRKLDSGPLNAASSCSLFPHRKRGMLLRGCHPSIVLCSGQGLKMREGWFEEHKLEAGNMFCLISYTYEINKTN